MKKLFFAVVFLLVSFGAKAQTQLDRLVADTLTNADTTVKTFALTNGNVRSLVVFSQVSKVSGTVSGKTVLQGSVDGSWWVGIDSLTHTDVTQNVKAFSLVDPVYPQYRVFITSAGTMKAYPTVWFFPRIQR